MKRLLSILPIVLCLGFIAQSCTKENVIVVEEPEKPPIAGFTVQHQNDSTTFINTSINWKTCTWNFGDGHSIVDVQNPVHGYKSSGEYTVVLTVKNVDSVDQITKSVTVTISEIPKPMVSLKNKGTWHTQEIEVSIPAEIETDVYLEFAYDKEFTEPAKAIFYSPAFPNGQEFESEINTNYQPSGELTMLKPFTKYFLRSRHQRNLSMVYTEPVRFTTAALPEVYLDVYTPPDSYAVKVLVSELPSEGRLLSKEISFYSDPERSKKITPWNWDPASQTFLPHLGEAVYVTCSLIYDYHDEVVEELYENSDFPYTFVSGDYQIKKYDLEKFGQGFKGEVAKNNLDAHDLKKVVFNCVNGSENSSVFSMNAQQANEEKNYLQITYLSSIYYPIQEKNYELVESDFTKGKKLGFRYFTSNQHIVEFRVENGTSLYSMDRPLIRIDD